MHGFIFIIDFLIINNYYFQLFYWCSRRVSIFVTLRRQPHLWVRLLGWLVYQAMSQQCLIDSINDKRVNDNFYQTLRGTRHALSFLGISGNLNAYLIYTIDISTGIDEQVRV